MFILLPDENDLENNLSQDPINVLNLLENTQEYLKCGESDKIINTAENATKLEVNDEKQDLHSEGYESPVKVRKPPRVKSSTPTNERPQYYTNMNACRTRSN